MSDVLDQLDTLTKQGEDYIWRPARTAVAEITRLRAVNAALESALKQVPRTVERLLTESGKRDSLNDMLDEITAEVHQALTLAKGEKT